MLRKSGDKGLDARHANERHHHVDAVGGWNLRGKLIADTRLARSVRQERGIEQRCRGISDFLGCAVDAKGQNRTQHFPRLDRQIIRGDDTTCASCQLVDKTASNPDAKIDAVRLTGGGDRSTYDTLE